MNWLALESSPIMRGIPVHSLADDAQPIIASAYVPRWFTPKSSSQSIVEGIDMVVHLRLAHRAPGCLGFLHNEDDSDLSLRALLTSIVNYPAETCDLLCCDGTCTRQLDHSLVMRQAHALLTFGIPKASIPNLLQPPFFFALSYFSLGWSLVGLLLPALDMRWGEYIMKNRGETKTWRNRRGNQGSEEMTAQS